MRNKRKLRRVLLSWNLERNTATVLFGLGDYSTLSYSRYTNSINLLLPQLYGIYSLLIVVAIEILSQALTAPHSTQWRQWVRN